MQESDTELPSTPGEESRHTARKHHVRIHRPRLSRLFIFSPVVRILLHARPAPPAALPVDACRRAHTSNPPRLYFLLLLSVFFCALLVLILVEQAKAHVIPRSRFRLLRLLFLLLFLLVFFPFTFDLRGGPFCCCSCCCCRSCVGVSKACSAFKELHRHVRTIVRMTSKSCVGFWKPEPVNQELNLSRSVGIRVRISNVGAAQACGNQGQHDKCRKIAHEIRIAILLHPRHHISLVRQLVRILQQQHRSVRITASSYHRI